jgi:dipeptidyl aminopeptidase/acylaminoacyl peptidase
MAVRKLILFLACATALRAQNVPQLLQTVSGTTQFGESTLSPDGRWLAWTVALRNKDNATSRDPEIWLLDLAKSGAAAKKMHEAKLHAEHGIAFSPDSKQIVFLSDTEKPGQFELYIEALPTGTPRRLTNLTGFLNSPHWSPDGKRIAILFTENAAREAGPLQPSTKDSGPVEEHIYEQRLTLIDPQSGQAKQITPADTYVYEYDWAPSSDRLAYTASQGNGDNNWYIAQLFIVSAQSGQITALHKPALQIANPRWSPDSKQIAFIGGIMSDEGVTGGDIYVVPATGGTAQDLTPGRKSSPGWLQWMRTGKILFTETIDGSTAIATLNPSDKVSETLWKGDETLRAGANIISASDDGKTLATVRSSWNMAPEVWAGPAGEWTERTHDNDELKQSWGRSEKLHWTSDHAPVEGWLLYPANYNPAMKYPLVVSVHGGPASAKKPSWPAPGFDMSVLSSQGYFVLFPNPRGSYGAGEAFTHANVKDFGHGDLRDINAGVDQAIAKLPIDPNRIGITGWSYGGYMTMWSVTQSTRFHAAVAGAGIANWQSYYGENLIDQWLIPYFGASVYDDPAVYARSSPITYIKNVKTPTLILVGDGDAECPAPQSYEFWHALRTLGVKTQLVIYPGEGHAIRKPEHQKDILERTIAWFDENLR